MVIEGGFTVVARWDRLVGLSFSILHKVSIEITYVVREKLLFLPVQSYEEKFMIAWIVQLMIWVLSVGQINIVWLECSCELDDVLAAYLVVAEAVDDPHWAFDVYLLLQVDLEPSTILSKVLLEQSVTSTGIFVKKTRPTGHEAPA